MSRVYPPNRRTSFRRKFRFSTDPNGRGELTYFGTASFFSSAPWAAQRYQLSFLDFKRPQEVFLDCAKTTSDAAFLAEEAAIYASFALQYGCPLEALLDAGPKLEDGSPAGPVGAFLKMIKEGRLTNDDPKYPMVVAGGSAQGQAEEGTDGGTPPLIP